jgi:phosphoribosylamine--glycine ligase
LLKTSFTKVCQAVLTNRVNDLNLVWSGQSSVCVVLASKGYSGSYQKGFPISLPQNLNSLARFNGVDSSSAGLVTYGGRVMALVG